ncbi:MAG: Permease of the drug/metabolite transporter (DMT) superfamily, partial [uncultured Sphingomonadaceae bacterium]
APRTFSLPARHLDLGIHLDRDPRSNRNRAGSLVRILPLLHCQRRHVRLRPRDRAATRARTPPRRHLRRGGRPPVRAQLQLRLRGGGLHHLRPRRGGVRAADRPQYDLRPHLRRPRDNPRLSRRLRRRHRRRRAALRPGAAQRRRIAGPGRRGHRADPRRRALRLRRQRHAGERARPRRPHRRGARLGDADGRAAQRRLRLAHRRPAAVRAALGLLGGPRLPRARRVRARLHPLLPHHPPDRPRPLGLFERPRPRHRDGAVDDLRRLPLVPARGGGRVAGAGRAGDRAKIAGSDL